MIIREIHGAKVGRAEYAMTDSEAAVRITDEVDFIRITVSPVDTSGRLTAEEARFIANMLHEAADRLDERALVNE